MHLRVAVNGQRFLAVGFAFVRENWIPFYITLQHHLHIGDAERESAVYLKVMVTDKRVGSLAAARGCTDPWYSGLWPQQTEEGALRGWLGGQREEVGPVRLRRIYLPLELQDRITPTQVLRTAGSSGNRRLESAKG